MVAHLKKPAKAIGGVDKIIINYQCYGLDTVSSRPQIELTLDSKGRTRVILNKTRNTKRPHAWNGLNHMAYFIARGIMIGVSRQCLTVQIGGKGCATYSFVKLRDALVDFIEKITQNKPREEVASLHVFCDADEILAKDVKRAIESGGPLNKSVTYFLSKYSDQLSGIAIGNVRKGICSLRVYDKQLKCRTFPRDLTSIRQRYAGTYIPRTRFEYHITSRLLRGLNIYTLNDLIENSEVLTEKLCKHYVLSSKPRKPGKSRQPDPEWIKFCGDLNKWSANLNLRVSCNPIAELDFETRLLGQSKSVAGSIWSMIQQSKQNGLSDEGAKRWICDLCNDALGQDGTGIILVDNNQLDGEPS